MTAQELVAEIMKYPPDTEILVCDYTGGIVEAEIVPLDDSLVIGVKDDIDEALQMEADEENEGKA